MHRPAGRLFKALSQVEHGVGLLFVVEHAGARHVIAVCRNLRCCWTDCRIRAISARFCAAPPQPELPTFFAAHGTAFAWSPKVLRAGMGAHFLLRIYRGCRSGAIIAACNRAGAGNQLPCRSHHLRHRFAATGSLVVRPRRAGNFRRIDGLATHQVGIPHLGRMESLNVAASAAVCFFEQSGKDKPEQSRPIGWDCGWQSQTFRLRQYTRFSSLISCKIVLEISSIDFVVEDNQRIPSRFIIASASLTS